MEVIRSALFPRSYFKTALLFIWQVYWQNGGIVDANNVLRNTRIETDDRKIL